ncbi:hypothetical protein Q5M85_18970 [Paraclostridium bifermentans]|nr:hypothetical protein [Paraclostridium bifermentans]
MNFSFMPFLQWRFWDIIVQ